jgi:DNA invertase Pin-like site-specific DNA recombinase/DNA-binding transcriptional ArsR family regulator
MTETLHIYTRVSTKIQDEDGTSLDTQKDFGVEKSKDLGMKSTIWNEGAKSSHNEDLENRPVLMQLLSEVENGVVKHLWVFNNDRLSRNEITQQTIKIALQRNNVVLYTKDGQFDLSNPTDKLFKTMLDGVASYDNALRAERSRLGKIARVKQGFWYGAPPPFGYELVDKKLSIHPDESKWVKEMFKWFYNGKSIIWIKSQLDKNGVEPRRKKGSFSTGSINRLLQNTHFIGEYTWTDKKSGETVLCTCPIIVDETVWNEVQDRRKRIYARKGQNNRTKRFYLLRNLMWCGECGSKISGRIHPARNQQNYFCPNKERKWVKGQIPKNQKWKRGKVGKRGCSMVRSLNIPITDKFVWDLVIDTISNSSILKEGFKDEILKSKFRGDAENQRELRNQKTKTKRLMKELTQIQSSIADVETDNLLKRYDDLQVYAKIKSNLDDELKSKKDEIEQTRIRTKELGNQKKWLDWVEKYADKVGAVEDFTNEEKKEYLEGVVERIEVGLEQKTNDHHLKITFKMGLVDDGIEYDNPDDKKSDYTVVEGEKDATVIVPYAERRGRKKTE